MISCTGKINSYGNNGFLDIYNLLTYKFYNENKTIRNNDYISFLKKNSKLDKQIESIMKKQKIDSYKILIKNLEKIFDNKNKLLNKLNEKIKLLNSIDISYENFEKMIKEIDNIDLIKNKLNMEILLTELLEGTNSIENSEKYSLYKHIENFFDITKKQSEQFVSDTSFEQILKSTNNTTFQKFINNIENELDEYKYIKNLIIKMNEITYISPYKNKLDSNKLNIEIDTMANYKEFLQNEGIKKYITKKAYPIIKPLIIYTDNNISEITSVYSPKIWKVNNNFDEIYNEVFDYIKINYLYDIKDIGILKQLNSSIKSENCKETLNIKYNTCNKDIIKKEETKDVLKNKIFSVHRLLLNINKNYNNIFNDKLFLKEFIFSKYVIDVKKIQTEDNIIKNPLYKSFLSRTQNEIYDIILRELDKSAFNTLLNKTNNKNNKKEDSYFITKLNSGKIHNAHKTKLKNKSLKNVIKLKYNYLLDELFTNNRVIDDESIEIQKRRKILVKFSSRYDKEIIEYDRKLENALLLNKDYNLEKKSNNILKNLMKQENIKNELSQLFTDLLLNGKRLHTQLQIDLNFIKKTNNFIIRLLQDILKIKSNINKNYNDFGQIIEHILVKKPINLEFTRETLELIHNEEIELDYFDHEIFYILLSYLSEMKTDGGIIDKVYNLLTNLKKIEPEMGAPFNCFENINHIINTEETSFNYKPYIWMWPKNFSSKWTKSERKMINNRKSFLLAYPYVLTKTSEITKKEDLYPCILKWLSEDDMIFVEMAKNFKSTDDEESLNILIKSVNENKSQNILSEMKELNIIGNILENIGVNITYKNNKKQGQKCLLPNKITIKDEIINTKKWKNILLLQNDIQYYFTQIKNRVLIQISFLEKLSTIIADKSKNRELNRIQKKSHDLFIKKIIHFISFLHEIHIEKYMTKQKIKQETQSKTDSQMAENNTEDFDDDNNEDEDFITDLDDIF